MLLKTLAPILAVLLMSGSPEALAQDSPASAAQSERNLKDFDFVVSKIAANYAGWDTKVTAANKPDVDRLTATLRARAASANDGELLALLAQWIMYFKDRHVTIANAGTAGLDANATFPTADLDEKTLRARLSELGSKRHPVEGIWDIAGTYRVGVIRNDGEPNRFRAVVLTTTSPTWQPKQIKAELEQRPDGIFDMRFFAGDHGERRLDAKLHPGKDALLLQEFAAWYREWPTPRNAVALRRMVPPTELTFARLSPRTLWLRIPDFGDARRKPLEDILAKHREALDSTPNLVIDLRNNGGGSDYVYGPLIPLLYTHPVVTIGMELRASEDNLALREKVADDIRKNSAKEAAEIDAQNRLLRARLGQYVQPDRLPFSITTENAVLPFPKRVAVLVDGAGSTGEQFLLLARQSRKTTLMGQRNSAGVLDFANVVGAPTPSGRYMLRWATSRSLRLPNDPVDPHGIPPEVKIPASVDDPVMWAARWLERQVD